MSGIYIKGMEMPKSCIKCKLLNWKPSKKHYRCPLTNEKIDDDTELSWGYMSKDCPLVEVPPPHGRLIDADRMISIIEDRYPKGIDLSGFYLAIPAIKSFIEAEPTIIESEE